MKLLLAFLLVATSCTPKAETVTPPSASTSRPTPLLPDASTRAFVQDMFGRCGAKHSEAKAVLLRNQIARIVTERIEGREAQQAFVFMLCIESKFTQTAKSPVGAIGIAQIMPQYIAEFSRNCGLGAIKPEDIADTETNLHLGACLFDKLVKETGNVMLAAASYNAGLSSSSVSGLKNLQSGNAETMGYVAKVAMLMDETNRKEGRLK